MARYATQPVELNIMESANIFARWRGKDETDRRCNRDVAGFEEESMSEAHRVLKASVERFADCMTTLDLEGAEKALHPLGDLLLLDREATTTPPGWWRWKT